MMRVLRIAVLITVLGGCNLFEPVETPDASVPSVDVGTDIEPTFDAAPTVDMRSADAEDLPDLAEEPVDMGSDAADLAEEPDLPTFELPRALIAYDFEEVVAGAIPDVGETGLYPMKFEGQVAIADGHATFSGGALASDPPEKFYDQAQTTGTFAVSLWLETGAVVQGQLDDEVTSKRLITMSANSGARNFTIAQLDDNVMLRITTTETSTNGTPSEHLDNAFDGAVQHHFVQVEADRMRYWVDGVVVYDGWPGGTLSWDPTYAMMLGGEFESDRIWSGTLHDVRIWAQAFDDATIAQIYAAGIP